jgi:CubicO group peptidase (beta-lactamase class C family)
MKLIALAVVLSLSAASIAYAAPDEQKLWKASGYRVGNASNWYYDESVRVGSFTHEADIPGIFRGKVNVLKPSPKPMALSKTAREPDFRWRAKDSGELSVDDYLARQRIMGLIIIKDGVVQVERYQYDRKPTDRFTSHSMAKSITALAVGFAQQEGRIRSLDDRADQYAPKLRGTIYGDTPIRNLLRMASGAKYEQTYDGTGDTGRFSAAIARDGIEVRRVS